MLQSAGDLTDDDLEAAYAYPSEGSWSRLNFVASLDGATADGTGRSDGLSAPGDRRVFALLRSLADVIVVGAGTARAEGYAPVRPGEVDTALRHRLGLAPLPPLAVVSSSLDLPDELLSGDDGAAPTLVITCEGAPAAALADMRQRAELLVCGTDRVDHREAREQLAGRGLRRILTEGGPVLAGAMFAADVLDELCLTLSPQVLAGDAHRLATGPTIDPAPRLQLGHVLADHDHLLLRYTRAETS
ncbi:MAG: pyrimidine reductase family protein [Actinomycetota bacterium]|nr:pyrimidine reductase family protein [Actinomycetota bacterium]